MLPVLLINLARSPDRLSFMARQFEALGLAWTRVDAVDATADDFVRPSNSGWLTDTEVAVWRSHQKCWRLIAEHHPNGGVVLEDDVHLSKRLPSVLKLLSDSSLDLVKLETGCRRVFLGERLGPVGSSALEMRELLSWHGGAAGYYVTPRASKLLLEIPVDRLPVDVVLFEPVYRVGDSGVRVAQLVPAMVVQDQIVARRCNDVAASFASTIARHSNIPRNARRRDLGYAVARIRYKLRVWFTRITRLAMGRRYEQVPFADLVG